MTDPTETISIENVVASTSVDQELNLDQISEDLPVADYDPENFPGLIYRMQDPKSAALIFRSGNVVCTGASSEEAVRTSISIVFDTFDNLGITVPDTPRIDIQNMVASADLGDTLNLNALAIGLGLENVEYEPEQFPGLVYRLVEPDAVVLLFGSGKVVITGAETNEEITEATSTVERKLDELGMMS